MSRITVALASYLCGGSVILHFLAIISGLAGCDVEEISGHRSPWQRFGISARVDSLGRVYEEQGTMNRRLSF
jgi:hypothetical protein